VISINDNCLGSIFYVSLKGDDLKGTGSAYNPWRSLHKACEEVKSFGDTIYIKTGIYDEVRTSRLARGVSIIGEGSESIITSTTLTREWTPIVDLRSDILQNGNQTISHLRFDGSSTTAAQALWIAKRHNVAIHDCIFTDFMYTAVLWVGDGGNSGSDPYDKAVYPQHYVTGSRFYNNSATLNGEPDNMIFSENMKVNPEICSDHNLRLKQGSKGIKAGIHIPDLKSDKDGIEPGNPPNLGCYESIAVDEFTNHENKTGPRLAIVASIIFFFCIYNISALHNPKKELIKQNFII